MLIALAGLAGAGKTTAIGILERQNFGRCFYAGKLIEDELNQRGLALTAQNERKVRIVLRDERGMDMFARLAYPSLSKMICSGPVLLDAIYCIEEHDFYRKNFGTNMKILAINASQNTRSKRLAIRRERPIDIEDLVQRDALELDRYRLKDVISLADHIIDNEGSLSKLEEVLKELIPRLGR
jgi:dephospho-CoA kinase